ncbi:MAG TPA: MraY family glycosyltransferase [Candidatus Krumholzibacteriaceae bacterium]
MANIGLILAVVLSFALSSLFTPLVRGIAVRLRICEKPNGRTSRDIVHIGGVGIIGAILFTLIPLFLFYLPGDSVERAFIPVLIASGFLVFLLGIIDDLRSLHYIYKLILQVAVSIFVASVGLGLLMHFGAARVSVYLLAPLFLAIGLWMLVVTTSFNLIDGLDGLASGLALIAAASFAVAGYIFAQPLVLGISLVVCGAVAAFLRYNFPPATIFMGDSGSLFLGLLFGLVSLLLLVPGTDLLYRIAGDIVILAVPLLDTALALTRRLVTRRPVFEADHRHLHHMLLYRFRSTKKVDLALWGLSAVFGALGVLTMRGSAIAFCSALVIGIVVFVFALRRMVHFELPESVEEEILGGCGITASASVSRQR